MIKSRRSPRADTLAHRVRRWGLRPRIYAWHGTMWRLRCARGRGSDLRVLQSANNVGPQVSEFTTHSSPFDTRTPRHMADTACNRVASAFAGDATKLLSLPDLPARFCVPATIAILQPLLDALEKPLPLTGRRRRHRRIVEQHVVRQLRLDGLLQHCKLRRPLGFAENIEEGQLIIYTAHQKHEIGVVG